VRHILNYRDPRTAKRKQLSFECQKDAQAKRNELIPAFETGLSPEARSSLTVAKVVSHWLEHRRPEVKPAFEGYAQTTRYITDPLLLGGADDRSAYAGKGILPEDAKFSETWVL
jgi:integrase